MTSSTSGGAAIWYISKYVRVPSDTGSGGRGYELMRELALLGFATSIVTSDSNHLADTPTFARHDHVEFKDGVRIHWLRTIKANRAKSLRRILSWIHFEWALLRHVGAAPQLPSIIIASSPSILTWLSAARLARKHRARLVVEVRDIWPLTLIEEGGFHRWNPAIVALGYLERWSYRRADLIVGTMPNLAEHVAHVLGYDKAVHVAPIGVPRHSTARPTSTWSNIDPPPNGIVVAYSGTIGITNALDILFRAASILIEAPIHFVILGDGALLPVYKRRYSHLPNVSFLDKVAPEAVPAVLEHTDLLVLSTFPSRVWDFGQSLNKLVDYMVAGKPIVASYTGFLSMIDEANCGTFVPAGDVTALANELLRYASMTDAQRARLGANGRRWVLEHRSYSRIAADLADALRAILEPAPGARTARDAHRGESRN